MRSLLRATARLRRLVALAACLGGATVATAPVLGAQAPTTALTVQVRDELGRPVSQATLTATYDTVSVRRITNDSGLPRGEVVRVIARRIGFAAGGTRIELGFGDEQASITLRRLSVQTLDTVRVLAQRAVRGLVVSAALQQPIRGASVRILETRSRLVTDSTGGFDVPLDAQRNVTLLVSADGFAPVQRIERLDPGASVELLIVLDSANTVPTRLR
ncbi:MAG: carboxypeptidase-like regulatory domain-containing protein, partial [Gemmatimonadaceae bacterium]|nr:carboxypeptidase-like regulatory domain-containing protein [Gemmatimonadaceae bacterium]